MYQKIKDLASRVWMHRTSIFCALTMCAMIGFFLEARHERQVSQQLARELKLAQAMLDAHNEALASTDNEVSKLKGAVQILDGAIAAETKRRVRINKVKALVITIIDQDNLSEAKKKLGPYELAELATSVVDNCEKYDIPIPFFLGLLRQESAFDPTVVHPRSGAQGLGQMLPSTADYVKIRLQRTYYNPFKISHNVEFAATYVSEQRDRFGHNLQKAAWAYNFGPEGLSRYLAGEFDKLPHETVDYEQRIAVFRKEYEKYVN